MRKQSLVAACNRVRGPCCVSTEKRLGSGPRLWRSGVVGVDVRTAGIYSHLFKYTAQMVNSHQGSLQRNTMRMKIPSGCVFPLLKYHSFLPRFFLPFIPRSSCGAALQFCSRALLHGRARRAPFSFGRHARGHIRYYTNTDMCFFSSCSLLSFWSCPARVFTSLPLLVAFVLC